MGRYGQLRNGMANIDLGPWSVNEDDRSDHQLIYVSAIGMAKSWLCAADVALLRKEVRLSHTLTTANRQAALDSRNCTFSRRQEHVGPMTILAGHCIRVYSH